MADKRIVSITASRPTSIPALGLKVKAGVSEHELDPEIVDKFETEYKKSSYYKAMADKKKLKIQFRELTQEEIDDELEALKKQYSEKGKYSELLAQSITEIKKIYEEEIGNKPGTRKLSTMLKEIIEHREANNDN